MEQVDPQVLILASAVYELAAATFYLTTAVVTLAIVGLIGYLVALRKARS